MENKPLTLVDIYNKDSIDSSYKQSEHIHAKSQRTRDEVIKDAEAFSKAIDKYLQLYTR